MTAGTKLISIAAPPLVHPNYASFGIEKNITERRRALDDSQRTRRVQFQVVQL